MLSRFLTLTLTLASAILLLPDQAAVDRYILARQPTRRQTDNYLRFLLLSLLPLLSSPHHSDRLCGDFEGEDVIISTPRVSYEEDHFLSITL